jgi:hypothetical protein
MKGMGKEYRKWREGDKGTYAIKENRKRVRDEAIPFEV